MEQIYNEIISYRVCSSALMRKEDIRMKTAWYSNNASVEEIVKVLKMYPSYKTSFFKDIVSQIEKVYRNNPTEVNGSDELFKRLYEIAELPNRILGGYTYKHIFYVLQILNLKKEDLVELYENYIGNARPIWVVEDFDGPAMVAKQYGPYMIIFFNETPTE